MLIREATRADFTGWKRLRMVLYPEVTERENEREMDECLIHEKMAIFVAENDRQRIVGFLEASIRPLAVDCLTRDVGYIESWFVDLDYRQQSVGAALVAAAENWARSKGCHEMASDCVVDNDTSLAAHLALGYEERMRLIHFAKPLS